MTGQLIEILLDELDDGPNVRRRSDTGLVRSIREHGVLQPITVCRRQGRFEVLYGHRRTTAARAIGLAAIPAVLVPLPDDLALRQLAENLDRKAVDPIDVARALRATLDAHPGMTQGELAKRIGRSTYYVSTKLSLLAADAATQAALSAGTASEMVVQARRKYSTTQDGRGRKRSLAAAEDGRSASVVVSLGAATKARATIGVDFGDCTVDVVLEDATGRAVTVTLAPDAVRILSKRLSQAYEAIRG